MSTINIGGAGTKITIASTSLPIPLSLSGFADDDVITMQDVNNGEVTIGVDGLIGANIMHTLCEFSIFLKANSDNISKIQSIQMVQSSVLQPIALNITVTIPSLNKSYYYSECVLVTATQIPSVKKAIENYEFKFKGRIPQFIPLGIQEPPIVNI